MAKRSRKGPGRPTKFSDRLARRILELAEAGKTPPQIAAKLGIASSTLYLWLGQRGDFSEAFNAARNVADALVECALFQRAIGYRHPAVKVFFDGGPDGQGVVTHKYTEVYPPDITAAKFWLSNRNPKRWREKTTTEHTGTIKTSSIIINEPGKTILTTEVVPDKE